MSKSESCPSTSIGEDFAQHIEQLLNEFRELRQDQGSIVQRSLQLIEKVKKLNSIQKPAQFSELSDDTNRIGKLIQKFESISDKDDASDKRGLPLDDEIKSKSKINVKKVAYAFAQLGGSAMLLESFVIFKRAGEMLAEFGNYFEKLCTTGEENVLLNVSLQDKINMFNRLNSGEGRSHYVSCRSSVEDFSRFQSVNDFYAMHERLAGSLKRVEAGYEGDKSESEYESELEIKIKSD